jgi:Undecaprenyl-phosphate glucose phosphotransferase
MAAFSVDDLRGVEPNLTRGADSLTSRLPKPAEVVEEPIYSVKRPGYSRVVLAGIIRFVEFMLIVGAGLLADIAYIAPSDGKSVAYLATIPCISAFVVVTFEIAGIYRINAFRISGQLIRLVAAWSLVFGSLLSAAHFAKLNPASASAWLAGWYLFGLVALLTERAGLSLFVGHLSRTGRLERRTAIVGGGPAADQLLEQLARGPQNELSICGIFDDRTDERSPMSVCGFPKLGTVDDLIGYARRERLDLVIFTLPISAEGRLLQMLRKLWVLPVDIRLAAHINKLRFKPRAYSYIGTVPLLDVFDKPIADWDVVLKYLFDKLVGSLCLLFLAPVMLLVAAAVKVSSPGPILFKQNRYGFNNELIEVLKFRSMYVDQLDPNAAKLVTRDDARVTPVGRFIRKTSLDELPQLINVVFKGNLSLVGPRPHVIHAKAADHQYDEVVDGYFARHRVKPGITGWAQIHGWRGNTDTQEKIQKRVECDLYYIENWSLLLDLYILAATPLALFKTENAF